MDIELTRLPVPGPASKRNRGSILKNAQMPRRETLSPHSEEEDEDEDDFEVLPVTADGVIVDVSPPPSPPLKTSAKTATAVALTMDKMASAVV